ncbi:MAG: hypothetical protein DRH56_05570 [Deltaproteobacteria bacterium]|nr:MAG: hypothetical protein DRH56_05570 [Deltaproteobacteria bacterium]
MVNLNKLKKLTRDLDSITQDFAREMEYEALFLESKGKTPIFNFMKQIFDNVKSCVFIVSKDCKILYANPMSIKLANKFGGEAKIGNFCIRFWSGKTRCKMKNCPLKRAMNSKRMLIDKINYRGDNFEVVSIPLYDNGTTSVLVIANKL